MNPIGHAGASKSVQTKPENEKWNWPYNYTFMSRHPNGAQFGIPTL